MEITSSTVTGILYIVATPIGNLDDISFRAINVLKTVDSILAEDTRHSKPFLQHFGIDKPLHSLHEHNELERTKEIIKALKNGQSIALISDAGTPLISDPGFVLVREARHHGITVTPIPGPCALIAALSAAGVPCENFTFAGFLPAKQQARKTKLESFLNRHTTVIFYESTHRIHACIQDILEVYGPTFQWVLAKEITKSFESFIHADSLKLLSWLNEDKARTKGEFVLILPPVPQNNTENSSDEKLLSLLLNELPLKKAVELASALSKTAKNDLYKMALRIKANSKPGA